MNRKQIFYIVGYLIVFAVYWKSILCYVEETFYDLICAIRRHDFIFIFRLFISVFLVVVINLFWIYLLLKFISWIVGL